MSHLQISTDMTWRLGRAQPPPPPPRPEVPATPLPATLPIAHAAPASDVASSLQFKPSNDISVTGLSYAWSFGDGGISTPPRSNYKYANAGDFPVELKLSNGAGQSRSASYPVSLDNQTRAERRHDRHG